MHRESVQSVNPGVATLVVDPFVLHALHNRLHTRALWIALILLSLVFALLTCRIEAETFLAAKTAYLDRQPIDTGQAARFIEILTVLMGIISPIIKPLLTAALLWAAALSVARLTGSAEGAGPLGISHPGSLPAPHTFSRILYVAILGETIAILCAYLLLPLILLTGTTSIEISLRPIVLALGGRPGNFYELFLLTISLPLVWQAVVVGSGMQRVFSFRGREGYWVAGVVFGLLHLIDIWMFE